MEISRGLVKTTAGYIHYRTAGAGYPVAIFSVNAQSSALMIELIEALARGGVRPIALDYPGHGDSDHIDFDPTLADYARWGLEVLDQLGVDKFVALGEATGAIVSAELAGQAPDRVDGIVLVNCPFMAPGLEPPEHAKVTPEMRPADASGFPLTRTLEFITTVDPVHIPKRPTQDWLDRLNTAQIQAGRDRWQAVSALMVHDSLSTFARVRCPALLEYASEYPLAERSSLVLERLPAGSRSVTIDDAVMCTSWEQAGPVADHALAFMRELSII